VLPGIIELAKGEPLLGYGFASFRYAFPPYRDPKCGVIFVWERAHNFFLEGMIDLGAMFIVVVVVAISALLIALMIGVRDRRRMRSYSALGLASMVLVGLHALVDFSLQIPGMAAYFAAIMATTTTISLGRSTEGKGKRGM
jgi:O-antigen ligase